MAIADINIRSGIGDGAADGNNTFSGNPSGTIGQILATDNSPTSVFQSELEGLAASTAIVLQANENITAQSNLAAINFATLEGGGGGNISFIADFDNNGVGVFNSASSLINASGRNISIAGAGVTTSRINTFTLSDFNGGAIALNAFGSISGGGSSFSEVFGNGISGNGGAIALNAAGNISITSDLLSFSQVVGNGTSGNGGAIALNSGGNITINTSDLNSRSQVVGNGNSGNGGAIALNSGGNISTFSSMNSYSLVGNGRFERVGDGNSGNGGAITFNASGNISGGGSSSSQVRNNGTSGNGGAITLNSAGNISTSFLFSSSSVGNGTSGNGGAITLNASGNISATSLDSYSQVGGNGNAGDGGTVTLTAVNNLNVAAINALSTGIVNYGNITLTGNEINLTGGANTVRGNNRNLIIQASSATQDIQIGSADSGSSSILDITNTDTQDIQIGSADSGSSSILDITNTDLSAIADGFSLITFGRSDGTGAININSNLNFSDPVLLRSPNININATVSFTDNSSLNFNNSFANLNTGGAIALTANEQLDNSNDLNLNGGIFQANGFNETLDLLSVSSNSTIDFGNGSSDLVFSTSSSQTWTGILAINNWSAAAGETLRFGTNANGLSAAQLSKIQFTGFTSGAVIDSFGFLTPTFSLPVEPTSFKLSKVADDIFNITNSNGKAKLQSTLIDRSSSLVNELGVFTVDDAQGKINGIAPSATGYTQAALDRSKVIFSAIANNPTGFDSSKVTQLQEFNSGENLRFYLARNTSTDTVKSTNSFSDILFSDTLNQKVTDLGSEQFSLGWQDSTGTSTDFKDLVVKVQSTNDALPLGTNLQGKFQGEVIDLRGITNQVKADFTVNRVAAFNNYIGFYQVADENGGIDTNGDGTVDLLTGQTGYIEAAVRGRVAGIDLSVNDQGIATHSGIFQPNSIFAPFIIVNDKPEALLDSNPSNDPAVYFPYLGANSDKADHIRLLGNNTFGFEDLINLGDKDFNDMIIKVNLSII